MILYLHGPHNVAFPDSGGSPQRLDGAKGFKMLWHVNPATTQAPHHLHRRSVVPSSARSVLSTWVSNHDRDGGPYGCKRVL